MAFKLKNYIIKIVIVKFIELSSVQRYKLFNYGCNFVFIYSFQEKKKQLNEKIKKNFDENITIPLFGVFSYFFYYQNYMLHTIIYK